jgi:hypothetical protein
MNKDNDPKHSPRAVFQYKVDHLLPLVRGLKHDLRALNIAATPTQLVTTRDRLALQVEAIEVELKALSREAQGQEAT